MTKHAYEKMGILPGHSIILINAPKDATEEIIFPGLDLHTTLAGKIDHIVLFVKTQEEMEQAFAPLRQYLPMQGKLWVAWPKAKKLASNLNVRIVIKIGYDAGLVESMNLSINETWTALKFTWPKQGTVYNNSYGTLPDQQQRP